MVFLATEHLPLPTKDLLSWMFDAPSYDQDKPVILDAADPSRTISCNQARKLVRQLVAGFQNAGLQKGDCVCVHSFNDIYYPILVISVIAAGGVFTGTNPAYTPHELAHAIRTSNAAWFISEPEILEPLVAATTECNISTHKIWIFHPLSSQKCPPGYASWQDLFKHGEKDWVRFDDLEACKSTIAMRLFSSGTTGLPKAVNISHYNLIAQHELCWEVPSAQMPFDEVFLLPLPMFHAATVPRAHTSTLKKGNKTYIMRRFDLEQYLAGIEKFRVTAMTVVPPMAIAIIMSPLHKKYSLSSIKSAISGAAPLAKETHARLQHLINSDSPFTQVWGMTESSCIATKFNYPETDVTGSIGRPIANVDMKLVDDDKNDIDAYDTRGEMCLRGPTIVPGYFDNPKANAESFDDDGFYHTGDIGYCDSKTKLWYIVDRKKELIKVRTWQVAPPEIEGILLDHPNIADAAVIGVETKESDGTTTELPRAYIVRKPGVDEKQLTEEIVKEYVKPKLTRYKWLDGGVRFIDVIPKNASGKILKRILREDAKRETASIGQSKL